MTNCVSHYPWRVARLQSTFLLFRPDWSEHVTHFKQHGKRVTKRLSRRAPTHAKRIPCGYLKHPCHVYPPTAEAWPSLIKATILENKRGRRGDGLPPHLHEGRALSMVLHQALMWTLLFAVHCTLWLRAVKCSHGIRYEPSLDFFMEN